MSETLSYERIRALREHHGGLRMLAATSVDLIASFLYRVFIEPNRRSLPYDEVATALDDYLFALRETYGPEIHPRSASEYLDRWSGDGGYLRKYYPPRGDEPELDITPEGEKAIAFLKDLEAKPFVGTESRLQTVFQLLRDLLRGAEQDPEKRIADLQTQRDAIDREIADIERGYIKIPDATNVRERFLQARETAAGLLSDFRQVEHNFRELDRDTREKIAVSDASKGVLLEEIFHDQDAIRDTDQGRSFLAFWEFLMSQDHQDELEDLIARTTQLEPIRELDGDEFLRSLRGFLLKAGGQVYETQSRLAEQLRKYLDDRVYLENRRMLQTMQNIEKLALDLKEVPPSAPDFASVDETRAAIQLIVSRGLFRVPPKIDAAHARPEVGAAEVDTAILYAQNYVDEARLRAQLNRALDEHSQITLAELLRRFPVQQGLAEIVTYFKLANNDPHARVNPGRETEVRWSSGGATKRIAVPEVIFSR